MIIKINTEKKYDIEIKKHLLDELDTRISKHFTFGKACIITDETVHGIYTARTEKSLCKAGFEVHKLVFPTGEHSKSFDNLVKILDYLAVQGFCRSDFLVALGGGVIGDLTGFAASIYMRGIRYIQLPTTLLSAVDSSIGGKTAVNLKEGKNLAGTFWQPTAVYFDTATLETLPKTELQNGISEIIKAAMLLDNSILTLFENNKPAQLGNFIEEAIVDAVNVKKYLVETDERENGIRRILNLGHTIGHAVEKCSNYRIPHGQAVAMGLFAMVKIAAAKGWCKDSNLTARLHKIYSLYGFDLNIPYTPKELACAALSDKKKHGDTISLIVPKCAGECSIKEIHISQLADLFALGISKGQ